MPKLNPNPQNLSQNLATSLYQLDYLQWIERTIAHLQHENYDQVEWEHLIEEIKDMGRSERRGLESNLIILLLHLLKWQYQPSHRSGSWEGSILEHRRRIHKAIEDSPSLHPYLQAILAESYTAAQKQAKAETGLPLEIFPIQCLYSLPELLSDDFLPVAVSESIEDMD
jgi:hypothetical protein